MFQQYTRPIDILTIYSADFGMRRGTMAAPRPFTGALAVALVLLLACPAHSCPGHEHGAAHVHARRLTADQTTANFTADANATVPKPTLAQRKTAAKAIGGQRSCASQEGLTVEGASVTETGYYRPGARLCAPRQNRRRHRPRRAGAAGLSRRPQRRCGCDDGAGA